MVITKFDKKTAKEISEDVSRILGTSRLPRKNLSKEEHQDLREPQQNEEIIIIPAVKEKSQSCKTFKTYDNK